MEFKENENYGDLDQQQVKRAQKIIKAKFGTIFFDEEGCWRFQFGKSRSGKPLEKSLKNATSGLPTNAAELVLADINACLKVAGEEIKVLVGAVIN